jgi:CheY-like chemotaxis protein
MLDLSAPRSGDEPRLDLSKLQGRVLLVDDDHDARASIADVLRGLGMDCIDVESADAALAVVRATTVDFLITDIEMPLMDGYQLAEALQANPPRPSAPRLIAMSAFSMDPAKRHLFSGFLAKPFSAAAIADLLQSGRPPDWMDSVR